MARPSGLLRSVAAIRGTGGGRGRWRGFSTSGYYDEAREAEKWEKITLLGIVTCTVLAIYNLSKGHHEQHAEPPKPYPYLRIHNKDFPWGPEPLFEHIKKKKEKEEEQQQHEH